MKRSQYVHSVQTVPGEYALYNALTDSLSVVTEPLFQALNAGQYGEIPDAVQAELLRNGILLQDNIDELRVMAVRHHKRKFGDRMVTSVTVLTTTACNFACPYCYEGAPNAPATTSFTPERVLKAVEYIKRQVQRNGSKLLSLLLFGGEPLANKPAAFQLLEELQGWCQQQRIAFLHAIITNGSLLDQATADKLASHNCRMIQITVDGPKEIHDQRRVYKGGQGSFEKIMETLKLICEHPKLPRPTVRINVDRTNMDRVPELLDELVARGLQKSSVDFGIVRAQTASCAAYSDNCYTETELPDVLPALWKEVHARGLGQSVRPRPLPTYCGMLTDFQFSIDPKGHVYKCWEHVGEERFRMGTIEDDGPGGAGYIDWMSRDPMNIPECKACDLLPVCGGGCAATALVNHGTIHAAGCAKTKGLVHHRVWQHLATKYPEVLQAGAFTGGTRCEEGKCGACQPSA
ncbi:MAG TPA: radical SAM protein [Symbiobacteriaceae bacterium]|nr:radical SAM protein [Symbiobacteriaceae bacterium]